MNKRWIIIRICIAIAPLIMCSACDETSTVPDGPDLAGFALDLPATVIAGEPFPITLTTLDEAGLNLEFAGTVTLSLDEGIISPASIELSGTTIDVEVTITETAGATQVNATARGIEAQFGPLRVDLAELPGEAEAAANTAIATTPFLPLAGDYSSDSPDYGTLPVSTTTLVLLLAPGATVGQVNGLITAIGARIAGSIGDAGILFLHIEAGTHAALDAAKTAAAGTEFVATATIDVLMGSTLIPAPNGGNPSSWSWQPTPGGGNWGLERIRAPQSWNLKNALDSYDPVVRTLIFDTEFAASHEDLNYAANYSPTVIGDHGTHVAGTIAALWNGVGVDGLNPFAELYVIANAAGDQEGEDPDTSVSWAEMGISRFYALMQTIGDIALINTSMGYNWHQVSVGPWDSPVIQTLVHAQGSIFNALFNVIQSEGGGSLLITAAGNDSHTDSGILDARYGSPMANAALEHGNEPIIVVKAVADGASPRIDAFDSMMDIDRVQGGDNLLHLHTDIDDGTIDGNRRTNDDGSVDMSDFRRWRDWLLQLEASGGLLLGGGPTHMKKDVNGDGVLGSAVDEHRYPRGDFNGDGRLDRTGTTYVPGAVDATVSDLDVLRGIFSDSN